MELTVQEAATLLGASARTVRARLARGDLPGTKRGSRWVIAREDLPLSERERARLAQRAHELRASVEHALASAPGGARRARSALDLETVQHARGLLAELRGADGAGPALARRELERALVDLVRGAHAYDRESKLLALRRARDRTSRAVAALVLASDGPLDAAAERWVEALEGRVLASLGGLLRWVERLGSQPARRRDA